MFENDNSAGHLGKLTMSLHWRNLGNQPAEILIEDLYLLVVPSPHGDDDPEESEKRAQAAKAERLRNAEILHVQAQGDIKGTIYDTAYGCRHRQPK
jgi:vacuolar protein sorting-associated protein 13A/C